MRTQESKPRRSLKQTGAAPGMQAILEWSLGADVADARKAADIAVKCHARGLSDPLIQKFVARCESPIERQFLLGFFLLDDITVERHERSHIYLRIIRDDLQLSLFAQVEKHDNEWECEHSSDPNPNVSCECTSPLIARVDFELNCWSPGPPLSLIVEIDGHDFHEKTKEQARSDKSRDRSLMGMDNGLAGIFRFTGSEIYRDPSACANEALRFIGNRYRDMQRSLCIAGNIALKSGSQTE